MKKGCFNLPGIPREHLILKDRYRDEVYSIKLRHYLEKIKNSGSAGLRWSLLSISKGRKKLLYLKPISIYSTYGSREYSLTAFAGEQRYHWG